MNPLLSETFTQPVPHLDHEIEKTAQRGVDEDSSTSGVAQNAHMEQKVSAQGGEVDMLSSEQNLPALPEDLTQRTVHGRIEEDVQYNAEHEAGSERQSSCTTTPRNQMGALA